MKKNIVHQANTDNQKHLGDALRGLSMMEKAFERLKRKNYYHESQYPDIFTEIEGAFFMLRTWINKYRVFSDTPSFIFQFCESLEIIGQLIAELTTECNPEKGKRKEKKSRSVKEKNRILQTLSSMLKKMKHKADLLKPSTDNPIGIAIDKAIPIAFERHCLLSENCIPEIISKPVSERGKKSIMFPWADEKLYGPLVNDKIKFRDIVLKNPSFKHPWGHKCGCNGHKGYTLKGFRRNPRKTIMKNGKVKIFPIRMAMCIGCGALFSLLPSFLPREKHFCMDVIGNVMRSVLLFGGSIRSAIENSNMLGRKLKSNQTILNWIKYFGFLHPAQILTRAGIKGSGYFQEDEGFEKEPDLRTYSVAMVDSKSMLVWHFDYVDHVDEKTLYDSFEKFSERINFKVLGVTKDKWLPSTKALKSVFHKIWIGFCHRHFLKKLWHALTEAQKELGYSDTAIKKEYQNIKKILSTASSQLEIKTRIKMKRNNIALLDHSAIRAVLDQLVENAVHYSAYKIRSGIKKTTSLVDNFLKIIKRKLKQAESFRDPKSATFLLRAIANTRNFVPFMPSAKNAHKSPFMLAQGSTYDLPWIQVMNVHNAFLFVEDVEAIE